MNQGLFVGMGDICVPLGVIEAVKTFCASLATYFQQNIQANGVVKLKLYYNISVSHILRKSCHTFIEEPSYIKVSKSTKDSRGK